MYAPVRRAVCSRTSKHPRTAACHDYHTATRGVDVERDGIINIIVQDILSDYLSNSKTENYLL